MRQFPIGSNDQICLWNGCAHNENENENDNDNDNEG